MIAQQIAKIVASFIVFLETTDDDSLDPDLAVQMMEGLAGDLQELDRGFLQELVDAFASAAAEYSGEVQQIVRNIPLDFYLEDVLAADDPVRLAELDALRDSTS